MAEHTYIGLLTLKFSPFSNHCLELRPHQWMPWTQILQNWTHNLPRLLPKYTSFCFHLLYNFNNSGLESSELPSTLFSFPLSTAKQLQKKSCQYLFYLLRLILIALRSSVSLAYTDVTFPRVFLSNPLYINRVFLNLTLFMQCSVKNLPWFFNAYEIENIFLHLAFKAYCNLAPTQLLQTFFLMHQKFQPYPVCVRF